MEAIGDSKDDNQLNQNDSEDDFDKMFLIGDKKVEVEIQESEP